MRRPDQLPRGARCAGAYIAWPDGFDPLSEARRSALIEAAEYLSGYAVEVMHSPGRVHVYGVAPTEHERAVIDEGLLRYYAAATADPTLLFRYPPDRARARTEV